MTSDRTKLVEKIKALRTKTVESGCTAEEAEAAQSKAQSLIEHYNVAEAELKKGPRPNSKQYREHKWRREVVQKFGRGTVEELQELAAKATVPVRKFPYMPERKGKVTR